MAKISIYLSLIPGTTKLKMRDSEGHSGDAPNFFTEVKRGDSILWKIENDSDIDEITKIYAKDKYFNILQDGAPKKLGNGDWKGKVKEDAIAGTDAYDIEYIVEGKTYIEDPELRLPPP